MELDMTFIDHWSIWLDLKILLKTIPAVFTRTGAEKFDRHDQIISIIPLRHGHTLYRAIIEIDLYAVGAV
jgi:hypothetical protein